MHRFRISPIDPSLSSAEIIAHDASSVLNLIERMDCGEAHVDRDGAYAFSARLEDNGLWAIYQRNPAAPAHRGVDLTELPVWIISISLSSSSVKI